MRRLVVRAETRAATPKRDDIIIISQTITILCTIQTVVTKYNI